METPELWLQLIQVPTSLKTCSGFFGFGSFVALGGSSWVRGIQETVGKVCQTLCGVHISVLAVSAKLFGRVFVAAHYLACVLRCILSSFQVVEASSESPIALYTRDLLQVVSTLFGNGWETGHPKADAYSAFLVLVGVMLTAYITSRVAMEVLLGASSTKRQPPSSDVATPPLKGKGFESVGTSVSQRRTLSRKPSRPLKTPAESISFSTQRSALCESAARTVESTFSKWSEAPQEPASPSVSKLNESPTVNPKPLQDTNASPTAAESEILQLLKTFTKTVQRLETKVDTLSLNRNSRAAAATPATSASKLHRSKSAQSGGSMYLSRNPAVYPRSTRYQSQERQVPT